MAYKKTAVLKKDSFPNKFFEPSCCLRALGAFLLLTLASKENLDNIFTIKVQIEGISSKKEGTLKIYAPSLLFHPIMPGPEASQLATTSVNKIIIVTNDVTLCLKRECSINSS